jgi:hypothetical protein
MNDRPNRQETKICIGQVLHATALMAVCYVACRRRPGLVVVKQVLIPMFTSKRQPAVCETTTNHFHPSLLRPAKPPIFPIKIEKDSIILSLHLQIRS